MSKDIWRKYVVRKYVTARCAAEAIRLSSRAPVIEVNEMQDKPETSNQVPLASAMGFQMIRPKEF